MTMLPSTQQVVRVFLAHPKGDTPTPVDMQRLRDSFHRLGMPGALDPQLVVYVTGEEDFSVNFQRYGGWNGWTQSVGAGKEYQGNAIVPRFDLIVVLPSQHVGRATADIVNYAVSNQRPVFFFDGMKIATVRGAVANGGDFKNGWTLV